MSKKKTQKQLVLEMLQSGEDVTAMNLFPYGITRLSAYINFLRNDGYKIETEIIEGFSERWGKTSYAKYRLKPHLINDTKAQ